MNHSNVRVGTVGGIVLSVSTFVLQNDWVKTIMLSALGACVSFTVSFLLKKLTDHYKNKRVR